MSTASKVLPENMRVLQIGIQKVVEWEIKDFFDITETCTHSPSFVLFGAEWYLRVYPNGNFLNPGWISLYLVKQASPSGVSVSFTLGIKDADDGSAFISVHKRKKYSMEMESYGITCFIERSSLLKSKHAVAPRNTLTVFCTFDPEDTNAIDFATTITDFPSLDRDKKELKEKLSIAMNEKETALYGYERKIQNFKRTIEDLEEKLSSAKKETEAAIHDSQKNTEYITKGKETLSEQYKELFQSECQTDFTVSVQGQKFKAHKAVLAARSHVFRAMFEADMTEKSQNHVDIHDCEPDAFHSFLLFLYSDELEVISCNNAAELYALADKYNVMKLREGCCRCLRNEITVDSVCDIIQLAVLHDERELLSTATEFFLSNSEEIIETSKWLSFLVGNLTVANELLREMAARLNKFTKNV